jgi:hypothetical protein
VPGIVARDPEELYGLGVPRNRQEGSEKSKGRPRKPLAEVILWSAPLRATSSKRFLSILAANRNVLKTNSHFRLVTGKFAP